MSPSAESTLRELGLAPHPEGGAYREVHRSSITVADGTGAQRSALTHIYYLLGANEFSRWHRIPQDELWNLYRGGPIELLWIALDWSRIERRILAAEPGGEPSAVVPGGCWQSASASGDWSLTGCTVAPGFEFADLEFLGDDPGARLELERRFPEWASRVPPFRPPRA